MQQARTKEQLIFQVLRQGPRHQICCTGQVRSGLSLLIIFNRLTLKARQAKFMAAQKARKGAKSVVRRR